MADTSVKFFLSTQPVTPPNTSTAAGSIPAILRACLVTGVGAVNVQTLTVNAGVATAVFATAHGYLDWQVVEITGATPAQLNGEHRLTVVDQHTISYPVAGDVPDGAATGAITARLAPAGWAELFSDSQTAVFSPTAEWAPDFVLRVNHASGNTYATARLFDSMTSVDDGLSPVPTVGQMSSGVYWPTGWANSGRAWVVVADHSAVYFAVYGDNSNTGAILCGCGEFRSMVPVDAGRVFIAGFVGANSVSPSNLAKNHASNGALYLAKNYLGNQESVIGRHQTDAPSINSSSESISGSIQFTSIPHPNAPGNGLLLSNVRLTEGSYVRGYLPGLLHVLTRVNGVFSLGEIVEAGVMGRKLLAVPVSLEGSASANYRGAVMFDLSDWGRGW